MRVVRWLAVGAVVLGAAGFGGVVYSHRGVPQPAGTSVSEIQPGKYEEAWKNIVASARQQALDGTRYDASYLRIAYPNGDVPYDQGACTDVIVRALRHAGYDLQRLIHEDAGRRRQAYPRIGVLRDTNIDHRRCPNQVVFFKKYGKVLTTRVSPETMSQWKPGDFVYWKLHDGRDHTGVVSDRIGESGLPMVIHNIAGCTEEDALQRWEIVGHYRFSRS